MSIVYIYERIHTLKYKLHEDFRLCILVLVYRISEKKQNTEEEPSSALKVANSKF